MYAMATPSARSWRITLKRVGLAVGERGRGFVHHEDPRALRQCLRDLHHLLLRDTEVYRQCTRVVIETKSVEHRARVAMHPRMVDESGQPLPRFAPEKDVLGKVQERDEGEFLENHRDAQPTRVGRALNFHGLTRIQQRSGIGTISAVEHLDQ